VRLTFRADPESGRMIRVDPGQDFTGTVSVRLEGSTSKVEAVASALRKEQHLEPGSPGIPAEATPHATVQLQAALAALPAVRDSGVTIAEVDPPSVTLSIDNLASRECAVRVELPPGQALDGAPEFNPPNIRVRYPTAISLPADLTLVARVDAAALAGLPEGRRTTLANIPVEMPEALRGVDAGSGVRLTPPQVSIALTLRSRTSSITLATIPVHIRLAPTELSIWDIQLAPESRLLTDVAISGPADLIDLLRTDKLKPVAYVALSFEDLEKAAAAGTAIEKEVSFSDLPTPLKFEPKQKTVRISVKRREAVSSPPGS
jgi:hypothetical protein